MSQTAEASRIYDWRVQPVLSYHEFLQRREYERSIRFGIDEQTKQLVASNEQLSDRGISVLSQVITDGICELSQGLDDIESGLRNVNDSVQSVERAVTAGAQQVTSAIYWGFNQTIGMLGKVSDQLAELIRLANTSFPDVGI